MSRGNATSRSCANPKQAFGSLPTAMPWGSEPVDIGSSHFSGLMDAREVGHQTAIIEQYGQIRLSLDD